MITGVVLARNEERNIEGCLRALRPHVEELLLIDMESTDRTVELATPLVDRVLTKASSITSKSSTATRRQKPGSLPPMASPGTGGSQ